jgi:hypothetical protein
MAKEKRRAAKRAAKITALPSLRGPLSGRPSAATEQALKAIQQGKLNPFAAAKKYKLAPSTIYRALAKKK